MKSLILMLLFASSTAWAQCRYNQACENSKLCWNGYYWSCGNSGDYCSIDDHCSSGLICSKPSESKNGLRIAGIALILLPTKTITRNVTFQIDKLEKNSLPNAQMIKDISNFTTDIGLEAILAYKRKANIMNKTTTEFVPSFTARTAVVENASSLSMTETNTLYEITQEFLSFSTAQTNISSRLATKGPSLPTVEIINEDISTTKDISSPTNNTNENTLTTNDTSSTTNNTNENTLTTNDTSSPTTENINESKTTDWSAITPNILVILCQGKFPENCAVVRKTEIIS